MVSGCPRMDATDSMRQPAPKSHAFAATTSLLLISLLCGCATRGSYELEIMPAPVVFEPGLVEPFDDSFDTSSLPYLGMLYATDRAPAGEESGAADRFYTSENGRVLRLGLATIQLAGGELGWDEIREASFAANRQDTNTLRVTAAEELGALDRSFHPLAGADAKLVPSAQPSQEFADLVNRKLALSRRLHIYRRL